MKAVKRMRLVTKGRTMKRKIFFAILYFAAVTALIFWLDFTVWLTEDEAAVIGGGAVLLYIVWHVVKYLLKKLIKGIFRRKTAGETRRTEPIAQAEQPPTTESPAVQTSAMQIPASEKTKEKRSNRKKQVRQYRMMLACAGILCVCLVSGYIYVNQMQEQNAGPESWDAVPAWGQSGISYSPGVDPAGEAGGDPHRLNEDGIPYSLVEFGQKYPEAQGFVDDYPEKGQEHHDIDLKDEVHEGEIPLFIQWDERWGYEIYGSDFLAITGCGPTCLSMVVCGLTGETDFDPLKAARFSEENGYYVPGTGTDWKLMTTGAEQKGLHAEPGVAEERYLREKLENGMPLICSMLPGDFTYTGHFIVMKGIDADGNVLVNDPNSRINSGKSWSIETLLPQINGIWSYSF